MKKVFFTVCILLLGFQSVFSQKTLTPEDKARFAWWQDARFGMFIHWGPCTLTGADISWSRGKEIPANIYDHLYQQFNPVNFDAHKWVQYAKDAGMKYIVFVVKHHDGFVLWDSKLTEYKITNTPFKRDVLRELTDAAHEMNMPIGIYFSPADWHDPDCRSKTNAVFQKRVHGYLTELLSNYGKISLVWFDFDGLPNPTLPEETYKLVRRLQPQAIINNRLEAICSDESHGFVGKWGDYATPENLVGSYCKAIPWETCETMGKGWPWRIDDKPKSLKYLLNVLTSCIGGNGNLLLNVGPNALGEFEPDFIARLKEIGKWVGTNRQAVYGTKGGPYIPTPQYACTCKGNKVFIQIKKFNHDTIKLPAFTGKIVKASLVDGSPVTFSADKNALILKVPTEKQDPDITLVVLEIKGNASDIVVIPPFTKTKSLAYYKPAKASSSVAPLFMYNAGALFDDNDGTYWTPGRNPLLSDSISGIKFDNGYNPKNPVWLKSGWVEVDLGKPTKVSSAVIKEKRGNNYIKVTSYKIEYKKKGNWVIIVSGTSLDDAIKFPKPVEVQIIRLLVEAPGKPAISEFQLF
jgi:alpha-L-fucosidase